MNCKSHTITTVEHAILSKQDFAYPQDFEWLVEQNFAGLTVQFHAKSWRIKVGHYLGVIGLPSGQQLEILPKISVHDSVNILKTRQWVQSMLEQTWSQLGARALPNVGLHRLIAKDANMPLSAWIQHYFIRLLQEYQPNQRYQRVEKNQAYLQGKLLIKEQLQYNYFQPHKFYHEFEQFMPDTACNRLIKTAYVNCIGEQDFFYQTDVLYLQLWHWQSISPLLPNQYDACFEHSQIEISQLSAVQQNHTQPLICFCYWLLKQQQALSHLGEFASPTFMINMQYAFEHWVTKKVQQEFTNVKAQAVQPFVIDNDTTILSIKPDLLFEYQEQYVVADVKWKDISYIKDVALADIYQLLTYAEEVGAGQAWLIYPTTHSQAQATQLRLYRPRHTKVLLVPFLLNEEKLLL